MSKRLTRTSKAELVETHNLALSLDRCCDAPYDSARWKRALYHALCMSNVSDRATNQKIREALDLP